MNKWAYFGKKSTKKMPILAKHANRDIQLVTFFIFLWKNLPQIMSLHIKSATHAIEYWKICHKHNLNAWNLPHKL